MEAISLFGFSRARVLGSSPNRFRKLMLTAYRYRMKAASPPTKNSQSVDTMLE